LKGNSEILLFREQVIIKDRSIQ